MSNGLEGTNLRKGDMIWYSSKRFRFGVVGRVANKDTDVQIYCYWNNSRISKWVNPSDLESILLPKEYTL